MKLIIKEYTLTWKQHESQNYPKPTREFEPEYDKEIPINQAILKFTDEIKVKNANKILLAKKLKKATITGIQVLGINKD